MRHAPAALLFVIVATLLTLTNCGKHKCDYYAFDFQKPLNYQQLVFRSSTIIVGTVRSVAVTRSGVPARKAPELLLDETRVDVEVENVLRGEWSNQGVRFCFFGYSNKNRGGYNGPAPYRVAVGERRIFFLTTDSGEFRSVADVRGDYSIRVWSGLHKEFRRSELAKDAILGAFDSRAIGNDISEILLELGEGPNLAALTTTGLAQGSMVSDELASRKQTVARLVKLTAKEQDSRLRLEACKLLAEQYAGQAGCLYELRHDPSLPVGGGEKIESLLVNRKRWNDRLKYELRIQPMFAFHLDSVTAVRDELELLVADPDPELKALACTVFKRNFPGKLPECGVKD